MNSHALGLPDVSKREVEIVNYLRDQENGATAREIYEDVSQQLGDTISRPAYYKLLDRLVAAGKIEQSEDAGVRRFFITPQLHSTNRLTLDDVYEILPFVENTRSMALAIEAQQYFIEHRDTTLRLAAQALTHEPAVDLFHSWIVDLVIMLEKDLASYHLIEGDGPHIGQTILADAGLERRISDQCDVLRRILYRYLSIPHRVVDIPPWDGPRGLKQQGQIRYDFDELHRALQERVFGVGEKQTLLGLTTIDDKVLFNAQQEMIISGSDGSFHAGTLGLQTAQGYIEDESFVITFNNAVAYIRSSEKVKAARGPKKYFHSAPLTRQTLDDPAYKGMLLAPFMFPMSTEAEYEHMTRAATDVVQMRVDDEVFNGKARDVATGEPIMPPRVHIRDGTITPQDRDFNHYYRMDPYGHIVQEGIEHTRSILQRIVTARGAPQIYAGAVKSTQIRLYSRLLNWYIAKGSKKSLGQAIDPNWDVSRASFISDIDAMTMLLAALGPSGQQNSFWISCVTLRQYASLTTYYDIVLAPEESWYDILLDSRQKALDTYERYRGQLPYHAIISEQDLENDSYLYVLEHADYASFYIGHTGGEPAPKVPRYEFLCSFRNKNSSEMQQHVQATVNQLATALLTCNFSLDRDHNFLSHLRIARLIPSVVYTAHEFAKQLGKKLEREFKSVVVARLAERRKQQINENDAVIRPISVKRYLQRFSIARQSLPTPEDENRDPF